MMIDFTNILETGDWRPGTPFAIAVSGGADSMALLLLADAWVKERSGHVVALTVNHGLRKESAAEAARVKEWCAVREIEHHTLNLHDAGLRIGKTQEEARNARYAVLTRWCRSHQIFYLLTAHHQGDQAETLFFRLARGSGIDGLACMAPVSDVGGVKLLRPLLAFPKSVLTGYLESVGQPWIEDPSNQNPRYTRTLIRQHLAQSPPSITAKAAELASRFSQIRAVLERETARHLTDCFSLFPNGGELREAAFKTLPPEYGLRVLAAITKIIGGGEHAPRSEKLSRFYRELMDGDIRKQRSFGHCLWQYKAKEDRFIVRREHAANP